MGLNKVAIVTPTILKDLKQLKRAVDSVKRQTYDSVDHIIVVDGPVDGRDQDLKDFLDAPDIIIIYTGEKSNTWGAYPRQFFLNLLNDTIPSIYEYVVHLDDDNYLFPEYVEEMVAAIEGSNVDAAICKIYHHGPVSNQHMPDTSAYAVNNDAHAVCIIDGDPPVLRNIDTLNVMVKVSKMKEHGWVCKVGDEGYCNDGETFEPLFKKIDYVHVDKILGIHY